MGKEVKIKIEMDYYNPKLSTTNCIKLKEIVDWSPPGKTVKYPFPRGENILCTEWAKGGICKRFEEILPEGQLILCKVSSGSWKHGDTTKAVMRVKEGATTNVGLTYSGIKGENVENVIDLSTIEKEKVFLYHDAEKMGYKISDSKESENLIALKIKKEGLLRKVEACKSDEPEACGAI